MRRLISAFAFMAGLAGAALAQTFYDATPEEIAGPPGSVIRYEKMPMMPEGATAYRVLYRSTGLNGEPIAVSGAVIVPNSAAEGERKVVAWAHPTTGVVPKCAPTLAVFLYQQIQGLRDMIDRGYVVAATDYPGLGTPGPHPYLVGVSEGRAVLDSVRAARAISEAGAGADFAVWGHSQGGQAALYTGLLARDYAPDLRLVGVAAAAPATELAVLLQDDLNTSGGNNLTAMTLWSWAQVFGAPIDQVADPSAMGAVDALSNECIESIGDLIARDISQRPLKKAFLTVPDLAAIEPWKGLLEQNTPGDLPPEIPVFLAQGQSDELVRPQVTADYRDKLCAKGSKVEFAALDGVGHGAVAMKSATTAVAWMADRFAGTEAPSNCGE